MTKQKINADNAIIYGGIGLLVGVILTLILFSLASHNNQVGMMRLMGVNINSSPVSIQNSDIIDAHFIEQMIPHHEDAITMAKLAPENASHQEIKTLSQNIITAQSKEITEMKQWYKDWYGRDLPTGNQIMNVHGMMSNTSGMHMGMMGNDTDLDSLQNSLNFDKSFIEEMIPHHQMAVMMANMLKSGTTRPEMKQLADNIITSQTTEIDQMRLWYKDWGY